MAPDEQASDLVGLLEDGEIAGLWLRTRDADLHLTDRRLIVLDGRVRLSVAYRDLRHIAFDFEPHQGTIVLVPSNTLLEAQVLWVTSEQLGHTGRILALIGERMGS